VANPILEYSPQRAPPRTLTVEQSDDSVRVIFPVAPAWIYWFPIILGFVVGLAQLCLGLSLAELIWHWKRIGGLPPDIANEFRRISTSMVISGTMQAFFWWGLAAYAWWKYHRWGRVPRVLTANDEGLILSHLGWRRMSERRWPIGEIKAIELRPVWGNLNWKRTVADLYVERHCGRRLRFRLSSPDAHLPSCIANQLSLKLGCPIIGIN